MGTAQDAPPQALPVAPTEPAPDKAAAGEAAGASGGQAPPAAEGVSSEELAPLAEVFARIAEARWAKALGSGSVALAGDTDLPSPGAARATGLVRRPGADGWLRAAAEAGEAIAGGKGVDARALEAWLLGVGDAVGEILGEPLEVQPVHAGQRPEDGEPVPDATVFPFVYQFGRRSGCAWLWLEPGLLAECLAALAGSSPAEAGLGAPLAGPAGVPAAYEPFPPLAEQPSDRAPSGIDVLLDVPLEVSVELGRTERQIREILALVPGSVLELDRVAGDPIDVLINGRRIARAEVVVVDERFAIRITDILSPEERLERLR